MIHYCDTNYRYYSSVTQLDQMMKWNSAIDTCIRKITPVTIYTMYIIGIFIKQNNCFLFCSVFRNKHQSSNYDGTCRFE